MMDAEALVFTESFHKHYMDSTTVEGAYSTTHIARPSPWLISASPTWEVKKALSPWCA